MSHFLPVLVVRTPVWYQFVAAVFRYNMSHLEQWLRDSNLAESGCSQALEPIIQASHLLQARKSDSDVDSICEMCSRLTTSQVCHV